MFAHDASWIFILSLGSLASCAADPGACTSEKIFARAVAEECGPLDTQSPTLDWTAFTGEIFEARSSVFIDGTSAAKQRLQQLLHLAGQSYFLAAQCPGAVATASYSLAEVQAAEDGDRAHWLRQLALLQLGLAMFPLAAHEECTQWPLRGRDLVSAFSRLGHKLFKQHRQPESRVDAGKVAVVSACGGLHTEFVRSSAQKQFRQYAERHGYDLYFFADAKELMERFHRRNLTFSNSPSFWRAYALQFVLDQRPGYDWLMWFDCDLIIDASQDQDLASLLAQHGVTSATEMLISADGWGIQPDLILLRASDWSRGFLENWTSLPSHHFLHGAARLPPELRSAERVALQHASLPHWQHWLQGDEIHWDSFSWKPEISLAMQLVTNVGTQDISVAATGTFALKDGACRGRSGARSQECQSRRLRISG